jgi:hypothetical protein
MPQRTGAEFDGARTAFHRALDQETAAARAMVAICARGGRAVEMKEQLAALHAATLVRTAAYKAMLLALLHARTAADRGAQ